MQLKSFSIFMVLSIFSATSYGQNSQYFIPGVFPQSPNTASQAKYGDYQVSMFTGIPEISIPLYEVKSGALSIPITLSYHASGVKVAEVSSWVGIGWSLSAGGSISRQVMGKPDDVDGGYLNDNVIPQYGIDQSTNDGLSRAWNFVRGVTDGRPDMFSYNFPGQSGKFFFNGTDHSFSPVLVPYSPIKINYSKFAGSAKTITGFDIKDQNGNQYKFGKVYRETTSGSSPSQSFDTYTSNWMMEQMVSQNKKDTMSFDFNAERIIYPDETSDLTTISDEVNNNYGSNMSGTLTYGYQTNLVSISASSVNAMLPSTISFKNGKVEFEKDGIPRQDLEGQGNTYALNKIKVYNYNFSTNAMELQKTIVFYKSYFNPGVQFSKRLKLDSIQVLDKAGSLIQRYAFSYNESIALPTYTSRQKDYWGYYNGKNNTSLIPQQWVKYHPLPESAVDSIKVGDPLILNGRNSDSLYMQAAVLTDIRYPTGGKTHFTYQTNQYRDDNNMLKLAGGLRVASILSYANDAAIPVVKTYKYLSAHPNFVLDNSCFFTQQNNLQYSDYSGCQKLVGSKRVRTFVSNSTRDLVSIEGSTVVYPVVEEYLGTPSENIGKSKLVFRDFGSGSSFSYLDGTANYNVYFYKRGQLEKKTEYKRLTSGMYQPVQEESNSYGAFPGKTYLNAELTGYESTVVAGGGVQHPIYTSTCVLQNDYSLHSFILRNRDITVGDNYKTYSITKLYDQIDSTKYISSTVEYRYDNLIHQQISRLLTIDSKGNTRISVSKYASDYLIGNTGSTNNIVLDSMLRFNMQAELIEKWDSLKNVTTGVNAITGAQLNLYRMGTRAILSDAIKRLNIATPVTNFNPASFGSNNIVADNRYVQMIKFDNYAYNDNTLLQFTPRNGGPTSVIWDYNNAYPVAQVKNAEISNPSGNKTSAYTSFEANGTGNWTVSGIPVLEQSAPTGHKVFSMTSGSVSLQNGDFSKPHVLTYWSNNGAVTAYLGGASYPGRALRVVRGWTLYKHELPAVASPQNLSISGASSIDELKTYPSDAQMNTYTYDVNGLIEMTDVKEQISRFEYDPAQRLKNTKDWQYNILKSLEYHNYNMTVGNDAQPTTTFTRNNCPQYTVPGSTTYSVAANVYYSVNKPSANALALYDLNTNGQDKANDPANCGCPIQYVTFTMQDQTGLGTYSVGFSGPSTATFYPASGTSTRQVAAGNGYTIQISAVGTQIKHFQLGNRPIITARTATFSNVNMTPGSSDLTLTIY